ncbi:hypothetical protein [Blastococcus goldschmidtiae]|uniref:Uncharacterized protein n=1 Tax=Blastococcus goldschmidtiae TaxID=3075546 RepID=A0ABU2KBY9_9ACTN|nr:hypothetical protein [Blastococcus sp. DSM 46792]MDT0277702.1 hypothetical protein [Blastococcus sp. DSM 46792]
MELLIWAAGAAVLLLVLVLVADRRQRRADTGSPHLPPSPGAPAHGSNSDGSGMLGG